MKEVPPEVERDRGSERIRREVVQHPVKLAEDHGAGDGERGGGEEENPDGVDQDENDGTQRARRLDQRVQTPTRVLRPSAVRKSAPVGVKSMTYVMAARRSRNTASLR
jgi:hypothetical protein